MQVPNESQFQSRDLWRKLRHWGSLAHLFSIVVMVLICVTLLPAARVDIAGIPAQEFQLAERRQLLLEAMDKIVRYQQYHREIHGRFTRDLERLGVPNTLSRGSLAELHQYYEFSVLEANDNRLLILVNGKNDRVTIDERHRVNANFILPPPSKQYLQEEGDRLLQLYSQGKGRIDGIYSGYWKFESRIDAEGQVWMAVGTKSPVIGERRELAALAPNADGRSVASIFTDVSGKLRSRLEVAAKSEVQPGKEAAKRIPSAGEVRVWLQRIHEAQHIYKREKGSFATSWEDLAKVTSFDLRLQYERAVHVGKLEITPTGYRVSVEGVLGDLLGEQFVLDESGQVKQIRYTDSIINRLQESTQILQSALPFQITEVGIENAPVLDSKKTGAVQSKTKVSDSQSME